jgi:Carbohydrate family 9 binding domain-like
MASRWTGRTLLPVACWIGAGACTLDFDRYAPDEGTASTLDGGPDASTDGSAADVATESANDASAGDTAANDVAQETAPNPCPPVNGEIVAAQVPGTITIDGNLSDWGATPFTLLNASDAALIMGPSGTCTAANATSSCLVPSGESAEVALLRDSTNLYIGVRVTVPNVGGTSTTDPYTDDAVELYLRGDATATGNYTNDDHQYVIDWQNLVTDYGPSASGTGQANPPGVTSAITVMSGNTGYVVEVKVALTQLGQTALTPGQTLGFDLGVDHGQGTTATRSFLVWWMATHAPPTCTTPKCTGCSPDQPYCDTLDFGLVCAG